VAWFPGFVQRAEGVGNVLRELRACGVDGLGGGKGSEGSELSECADDLLWLPDRKMSAFEINLIERLRPKLVNVQPQNHLGEWSIAPAKKFEHQSERENAGIPPKPCSTGALS
jgi:hypothetical protein